MKVENQRYYFYLLTLKKYLLPLIFLFFTICLLLFSKNNLVAAKSGLSLWANSVVPSLFPFFVATELLMHTNLIELLGKLLNRFMKPIFNIRGEGSFALIMGIISGYPIGAKIATKFRQEHVCSKEECERLLSFTNNSGPLFIIGTVGISMFGNSTIGILLFVTHILASLTTGFLFRFWKWKPKSRTRSFELPSPSYSIVKFSNLGEIIGNSIMNAISTIVMIGGFIVLFSVIISILKTSHILNLLSLLLLPIFELLKIPPSFLTATMTGIFEITNGIHLIASIPMKAISINILLAAFLLGFGGISVSLQVLSIVSKTDLSAKPYFIGKLLHGTLAVLYTYLLIYYLPFFNFNL